MQKIGMNSDDEFEVTFRKLAAYYRAEAKDAEALQVERMLEVRRQCKTAEQLAIAVKQNAEDIQIEQKEREARLEDELARIRAAIDDWSFANRSGHETRCNPIFAWGEILVRDLDEPLPSWVRIYMQDAAAAIFDLASQQELSSKTLTHRLAAAVGFSRRGWNAFEDLRSYEKAFAMASDYHALPGKRDSAASDVAEAHGVSPRTVYRFIEEAKRLMAHKMALRLLHGASSSDGLSYEAPSNDSI